MATTLKWSVISTHGGRWKEEIRTGNSVPPWRGSGRVAFFTKRSSDSVIRKKALTITKTQSSSRTLSTLELTCVPGNLLRNLTEYWGLTHPPWTSMQSGRVKAELYLLLLPCQAARPPYNPTGYSAEPNAQSYFIHCYMFFPSVWHMYLRSTVYYFGFSCNRYPYPMHPAF